ncbi:isoleucine patch superfamily enzyme, carbonic anhydrase/acetyltransferase [Halovivax ruber XH-70]|uniref:Isoleucine patch superfamily enzyme, carbonic anhydrase/acetyltransferase n=1 Tax=Halovivax ruber (strain DSM 18193 / JCM 13892 / XH-70) TaxID=797302 RepID=L0IA64_HALRX|nr:acyltransferase [Halovivax ruber]AGB15624.1 isoleucine patch superfamily enzyme, carbonic anhydrase/acetyltransferase [Halovivax ruber XH-70]
MVRTEQGDNCHVDADVTLGYEYDDNTGATTLGDDVVVRAGSIVYGDVALGDGVQTGHDVLIREQTTVGAETIVGTKTVIDGRSSIGSNVSLQTGVYVPSETSIGDNVFVGPRAVLTNDPYPVRKDVSLEGPTLESSVSVGANATILPGVTIGERSFVAAGAVVTEDVPPDTLAIGAPAQFESLPEQLVGTNNLV